MPRPPRSALITLGAAAAAVLVGGIVVLATGAAKDSHPSATLGATTPTGQNAGTAAPVAPDTLFPTFASAAPTSPGAPTPTTVEPNGSAAPTRSAAATPSAASSATTSTAAKATATPKKSATPARTTARASASATSTRVAGSGQGATPGTYTETTTGMLTTSLGNDNINDTGNLTVDPAQGNAQTQTTGDSSNNQVEKLVFSTGRVDATELSLTSQLVDADFVLNPQEPLVETTAGATWSWSATSTDGKEHLALSASYAGTESVTIGGKAETAAIIRSTLTITGSIATTITETDDYDQAAHLDIRTHQTAKGTYSGVAYTSDTTTTLDSLTPS